MLANKQTIEPIPSVDNSPKESILMEERLTENRIEELLNALGMDPGDMRYLVELSPYLILDGHRSGAVDMSNNPAYGYIEGALFSLKFATVLKELGGKQCTFLIHTLRNYKTSDRMAAIFEAIQDVGRHFIEYSVHAGFQLEYFGKGVRDEYAMADLINAAEFRTRINDEFKLNFLTNYSDEWAMKHPYEIENLPEINVVGRFTKGHYSGASVPTKHPKANFMYIQQASIAKKWSREDLVVLILSLLKSHLSLKGMVGGKSYQENEKQAIYRRREEEMWDFNGKILKNSQTPDKRLLTFEPSGPIEVKFTSSIV